MSFWSIAGKENHDDWLWVSGRQNENRIIGFGRFAGIVGAYNGIMAYGHKYNLYDVKPALSFVMIKRTI